MSKLTARLENLRVGFASALVLVSPMPTLAVEELLTPSAARFDVTHCDERWWTRGLVPPSFALLGLLA